jgi:hypothetical protein
MYFLKVNQINKELVLKMNGPMRNTNCHTNQIYLNTVDSISVLHELLNLPVPKHGKQEQFYNSLTKSIPIVILGGGRCRSSKKTVEFIRH